MTTILAVACAVLYVCGAKVTFDYLTDSTLSWVFRDKPGAGEFLALVVIFWPAAVIASAWGDWRRKP
jgi:hypothetical protein